MTKMAINHTHKTIKLQILNTVYNLFTTDRTAFFSAAATIYNCKKTQQQLEE